MKSLYTAWLLAVMTLVSFGSSVTKAIAQTTYPFQATYNTEITTIPTSVPNILDTTIVGGSPDAPYGLTNIGIRIYAKLDPDTGVITDSPDPAVFGLEGLPLDTTFRLFGNGSDELFGINSDITTLNFKDLVGTGFGTLTITGGKGRFIGASGTLDLLENAILSPDPTAPIISDLTISGSFVVPKTVPEPKTDAMLVGISVIGTGLVLRRHRRASSV